MKALFKAVYTHFTAQYSSGGSSVYYPVHINVGGRFYNTEAPQSTAEPYITYNLVSNYNAETFSEETESTLLQFNIFSNAHALTNVTTTENNLRARFDGTTFSSMSSSYAHTFCRREWSQLVRSDDTWHYIVQYRMRITK